jgi:hypothetical protein
MLVKRSTNGDALGLPAPGGGTIMFQEAGPIVSAVAAGGSVRAIKATRAITTERTDTM